MTIPAPLQNELIQLAHALGEESRSLAMLGEGNVSAAIDPDHFLVKASGSRLASLDPNGLTLASVRPILRLLDTNPADGVVHQTLLDARCRPQDRKPSVEASFHAWLLSLPEVTMVGHTHPEALLGILASDLGETFAHQRFFPDQIVCCGEDSVWVPYVDPGVPLAVAIRDAVNAAGYIPRTILLQNHGLIALGTNQREVLSATLMMEKAARVYLHAAACGQPTPLPSHQVRRIASRLDEHERRAAISGATSSS